MNNSNKKICRKGGDGGRPPPRAVTDPRLLSITPSQVLQCLPAAGSSSVNAEASSVMVVPLNQDSSLLSRRSRRRKRTGTKKQGKKARSSSLTSHRNDHAAATGTSDKSLASRDPATFPNAGNAPDLYWRAIPMEHLRLHPQFRALPHPNDIATIVDLEDVRLFRQDSWQWDALHDGRCTTSQAIAALGFLQPQAAEILCVPKWWQQRSAYARLRQTPLRTLEDMNRVLCHPHPPAQYLLSSEHQGDDDDKVVFFKDNDPSEQPLWIPPSNDASNFTMDYTYELSASEREIRRHGARKFSKDLELGRFLSRWWGDIHEATAVLVAMNYFGKRDVGFMLEETGMCGAGHLANRTATAAENSGGLLIGATPDGILRHSDGRVEVLEVKNHCPFIAPYANKQRITKKTRRALNKLYGTRPPGFDDSKGMVFPCYVPQLQLEMFCVGPECRSAVMVRLTARAGALIVRMQRDDDWIAEMLYWLNRFQADFVVPGTPPGDNFFWTSPNDRRRYEDFLHSTKAKSFRDVEFVARVPFEEVQRMGRDCPMFLD